VIRIDNTPARRTLDNAGHAIQLECQPINEAEASSREALKLNWNLAPAHNNLAQALKQRGLFAESVAHQRIAVRLNPGNASRKSALLFDLDYLPDLNAEELAREHRQLGEKYGAPDPVAVSYNNVPNPERRLRIGYLSPDLRAHSVAFFIESLLVAHNRTSVEVTCYANVSSPDPMTHRLREHADRWRNIWSMDDNQLSELISSDDIDILVDLAGHTANNRLRVFGMKLLLYRSPGWVTRTRQV